MSNIEIRSQSHNVEADFAASELARLFTSNPALCYASAQTLPAISSAAAYEPSSTPWPRADGLISILESTSGQKRAIALEYKTEAEGVHGILTGVGQVNAYLHKGYNASVLVIPKSYRTLLDPSGYVRGLLDSGDTGERNSAIGLFYYEPPDTSSSMPFNGKLHCSRPFSIRTTGDTIAHSIVASQTQWVHMREGSTTRDAFYRFLQVSLALSVQPEPPYPELPPELVAAVSRVSPGANPYWYLSNTTDDRFLSKVWRHFWFNYLATPEVLIPWARSEDTETYEVSRASTRLMREDDRGFSVLWQGRVTGLKEQLVAGLNSGTLSEQDAWLYFVNGLAVPGKRTTTQGIRARAHSFREDIDSALAKLDWITSEGSVTDAGYRYVSICERYGGANSQAAQDYLGATLIQVGHYGSFLHYIYRLSEEMFSSNPLAFTKIDNTGLPRFTEESYWEYLGVIEETLRETLKVMGYASKRSAERPRTLFQVELTLLRRYGFVDAKRYRLGVGLPIDWIKVQEAMSLEL